jgi:hypothetical protein
MASKPIGEFLQLIQKIAVVFLLSGGILLTPQLTDSGSDYRQRPGRTPGFGFAYPIESIESLIREWGML